MLTLSGESNFTEILKKIATKISDFWWIILLAVIALFVILFFVIACKNKRIKKLKRELKSTRTQLEVERSRARNEEIFAPVTGGKKVFGQESAPVVGDDTTERVELDPEEDSSVAAEENETEHAAQKVSYYNKTTEVSQKGGSVKLIVKYDRNKDSWVIKKEGVDRVVRRVDTKEEALTIARGLCRKYDANLVVHKKDGKFQKQ